MLAVNTMNAHGSTEDVLLRLLERYGKSRRAVTVNFRKLVPWIPVGERATHYLHSYPAKLLPQISAFFLANSLLSKPGDTVLDPFCGSGTVLLESVLHGRMALGADANPLARLIADVKVSDCGPDQLRRHHSLLVRRARSYRRVTPPDVVNIDYWFYPHVIEQLARLRRAIDTLADPEISNFFRVCFSACVRRVSLADPRLSVPVRLRENQYPAGHPFRESTNARLRKLRRQNVFAEFETIVETNIERVAAFRRMRVDGASARVISADARCLRERLDSSNDLPDGTVDLIVTSPPYAGAQKYIRASSLSIGWLGLANGHSLRQLEDQNIGREHFTTGGTFLVPKTGIPDADRRLERIAARNPLRALITATYLVEMQEALSEAVRVLKPGGYIVLVAANNRICGNEFKTQRYLQTLLEHLGLVVQLRVVDAIKSRGLMTRRNRTASVIAREWALLFQKPAAESKLCLI
jgi:DNA modification methylase